MNNLELLLRIKKENLSLLDNNELKKLYDWQENYSDDVDWEEFKDSWFYCEECKNYEKGACNCWIR